LNLTGSNRPLLLVHKGIETISVEGRVNIVLTPQFYTVKREDLPVKYHYQAKRIAPSLFEGLLANDGRYEYFVFKENAQWVFIAYNPQEIRAFLVEKGMAIENLSKIYFAQQIPEAFTPPIVLSEREALLTIDGNVVLIPPTMLQTDPGKALFDYGITPKSGITLASQSSVLLTQKESIVFTTLFLVFAGIFFLEGWHYSQNIQKQEQEMQRLLDAYPALQSKMQRESIALKYRKIDTREREKREIIKKLASLIYKGVTLTAYHMNEKGFKTTFSCANATVARKLKAMAQRSHFAITSGKGSNIVVIEGKL